MTNLADYAIYLDLDGVLADYNKGMERFGYFIDPSVKLDLNRSGTSHPLKREMYETVKGTDFYFTLPLLPGAVDLYAAVAAADPIILTAAPKFGGTEDDYFLNPYWLGAAYHKRRWVECHLLREVEAARADEDAHTRPWDSVPIPDGRFVCTTSARKWQFMNRKHSDHQILIDDRIDNVRTWAEKGGIGILHVDSPTSIRALRELYEPASNAREWSGVGESGVLFDPRKSA